MAEAVFIETKIDVDYKPAFDKIGKIEHRLDQLQKQRDLRINFNKEKLLTDLAKVEDDIETMTLAKKYNVGADQLAYAEAELDKLGEKRQKILAQIEAEEIREENVNYKIGEQNNLLEQEVQKREDAVRAEEEAALATQQTAHAFSEVEERIKASHGLLDGFTRRINGLIKRVFVFSLVTKGLRAIRSWFSQILNSNSEAVYAIRVLRGALLTLIQPLVQYVIPIIVKLIRLLTVLAVRIASFIAGIFGKTVNQSALDAQSMYQSMQKTSGASSNVAKNTKNAAKNAKNTADAMEDANESLAGFDKLNVIESDSGSGADIVPDVDIEDPIDDAIDDIGEIDMSPIFDFSDVGLTDELESIYNWVLGILGALAAFSLLRKLTQLTGSLKSALGIMGAIAGTALFIYEYIDAWTNGIDWGNLLGMLAGIGIAALALGIAFGPVAAAIALIVGGIALIVLGVKDMIENGFTYENFATVAAGLMLVAGAIALLTGSWIPLLVAAIVAAVILIIAKWEDVKKWFIDTFTGIWEFIKGLWETIKAVFVGAWKIIKSLFTGNLEEIRRVAVSVWQSILNAGRGAINGIIRFLNGMIDGLNTILWPIRKIIQVVGSVLGKSLSMEDIRIPHIPALAQGAVVPPNREFLARLGDNKTEPEIVSPLSTMQQAFSDTLASSGLVAAIERDTAVQSELLETLIMAIRNKQLVITPSAALGRVVTKSSALYKGVTG